VAAMLGLHGFLPYSWLAKWGSAGQWLLLHGLTFKAANSLNMRGATINWILICLCIVWLAPNTQQIMASYKPALNIPEQGQTKRLLWQPSYKWLFAGIFGSVYAILCISDLSEFIYFRF